MKVLTEKLVTDAEAKEILEGIGKKVELKYEQKNALDILNKFVKVDVEKIKNLVEELKKIEKLRERKIIAIANFLPEGRDDLRVILEKEYTNFTSEEIDLILETVRKSL
ncbi:MAG: RNA polymerase Rpb4 family protein [Candidatus Aenigmarchaeota archaeon]|nr:RNA polymerase Rpb4 family protein [Candidatus Aenigmarchaeota archaeon]